MKNDVPTANLYPCATDDSMFIIAAFRYALGRRTYAVECISTVLARLAPKMRAEDRSLIVWEIEDALAKDNAGDACDIESWKKLRDFLNSLGKLEENKVTGIFPEVVSRAKHGYVYEWINNDMMYRKVKIDESNPARVIKCNCGEPATHLDVFFAWESSDCWCDKCYKEKEKK